MFADNTDKIKKIITLIMCLIFSAAVSFAGITGIPKRLENYGEDYLYRKLDGISENIKIIGIDDKTLDILGPYSDWNREYFADLINILNEDTENRPEIIGIDIIFSGTNNSDEDTMLAETVAGYDNIILASVLEFDNRIVREGDNFYRKTYVSNEYKPYDELAAATEYGFTNSLNDSDGIVRKAYSLIDEEHKSFAYLIASRISDISPYNINEEIIYSTIPGEIETVSMVDVLEGNVNPSYFKDSIVLIGAYAGGMMDSYKVPCDYSKEMYGIELEANRISAFLNNKVVNDIPVYAVFIIIFVFSLFFCYLILTVNIKSSILILAGFETGYILLSYLIFRLFSVKLPLVAVTLGFVIAFILSLLYKYVELLRKRQAETQTMLFSMAEAFAEAIEGRTPYNANHTKNVAKRCVEMLDYINGLHKEGKSEYHFSKADKKQLYLAAMLHDVGKMDVPLEVMDKPTKLGSKERELRDRLSIIMLKLQNDILSGEKDKADAEKEMEKIKRFIDNLGAFNCGRPLKDEEWQIISDMEDGSYIEKDGSVIPYLTEEEKDDIHIKAGTLSDSERTVMQSHVVYTDKILSHMTFGDEYRDVRAMASNHHELLNGKGYPNHIDADGLDVMTRILTVMDIYDSLIADDRPYKKPKPVKVAFDILEEEAKAGKVDPVIVGYAKELYYTE
ncbi:MAG: CHASE2 domain-containing protein [Lachnospiraceae bacterium]|nr:CHASE2 domain-containing protein [Lachnospiraceae bacterium]